MVSGRLIQLRSGPASLAPKEPEALAAPAAACPKMGNLHARQLCLETSPRLVHGVLNQQQAISPPVLLKLPV
jgi:hypothetical protein